MDIAALVMFAAVFAIACASPGPAVAALLARVLGNGPQGATAFGLGMLMGDLVWLACAVFGLVALATLFQPLFLALKYVGVAYLLYLAWKLWTAPATVREAALPSRKGSIRLFLGGLAITLGNPKTMLFYLSVLPTVVALSDFTMTGFLQMAAIVTVVYVCVLSVYVALAARARQAIRNSRTVRLVNRICGTVMAGAAAAVAARG